MAAADLHFDSFDKEILLRQQQLWQATAKKRKKPFHEVDLEENYRKRWLLRRFQRTKSIAGWKVTKALRALERLAWP